MVDWSLARQIARFAAGSGQKPDLGVNLAGVRILFELEERLGTRILERLYTEARTEEDAQRVASKTPGATPSTAKTPVPDPA